MKRVKGISVVVIVRIVCSVTIVIADRRRLR